MPTTPELEKIRRAQIVDAALKTISSKGHANVKMDDIVEASGLSKGGIAHYFSSKEELFKDAFKAYFDHIFLIIKEILDEKQTPMDKLLGFEELFNAQRIEVQLAYPLIFDLMALAVHHPDYRQLFQNWVCQWVLLLESVIEDGIRQGDFLPMDAEETARTVSAVYQGFATRWFLGDEQHNSEWAVGSVKKVIRELFSTLLNK